MPVTGLQGEADISMKSGIAGAKSGATIIAFPGGKASQVGFDRDELQRILNLYGRMVAAGYWRDYAIDFGKDNASFCAFRRAAERPQARIEKRPELRNRQGQWTLFGEAGQVLKRGNDLAAVLFPLERRLLKVVEG
ncbi:hypothetical protein GCM10011371_24250 [Novosphingobium marinum]|nr:hypothetical protein GCM10011371_24250 [Novosphingobium marinum]